MEPHVIAIRHLELLSEADRRQRDARTARIFSRMRTRTRRRSIDE
jgi:hypothetical protein